MKNGSLFMKVKRKTFLKFREKDGNSTLSEAYSPYR